MKYVGLIDGKIHDICSDLRHKRDELVKSKDYIFTSDRNLCFGDTWNFLANVSMHDAEIRFEERKPSPFELLEEKVNDLESIIVLLEERIKALEEVRKE